MISLKTPQPKVDGDTYTWDAKGTIKYDGIGSSVDAAQQAGKDQTSDITIKGTYKDGQWRMTDPETNFNIRKLIELRVTFRFLNLFKTC